MALVYATRKALQDAERLLPGSILENAVQREIEAGNVHASRSGGYVFDADRRWVAHIKRTPGRLKERPRAWLVTEVKPHERRR